LTDLKPQLAEWLSAGLARVAPGHAPQITLERPKQAQYGDYSSNVALQLAKTLKRNPRELAAALIASLEPLPQIARVETAGAGFINIFLTDSARREGAAAIVHRDAARAQDIVDALKITAYDCLVLGVVDAIVPEPENGAHTDPDYAAMLLRGEVVSALIELRKRDARRLVDERWRKFRRMGEFQRLVEAAEGQRAEAEVQADALVIGARGGTEPAAQSRRRSRPCRGGAHGTGPRPPLRAHAVNRWGETTCTANTMSAWRRPQNSAHWPANTPRREKASVVTCVDPE